MHSSTAFGGTRLWLTVTDSHFLYISRLLTSAEVIQTALLQTDAVGDKVHVQFRRNGLKSSTVIERDSAQRFNCVIDWMEKQAEAATHATQHNDVVVVRHQIRGPNTMRRTNVAAKMWFNNVLARV